LFLQLQLFVFCAWQNSSCSGATIEKRSLDLLQKILDHWNCKGMILAGNSIIEKIQSQRKK
jgi:hypothetical protein